MKNKDAFEEFRTFIKETKKDVEKIYESYTFNNIYGESIYSAIRALNMHEIELYETVQNNIFINIDYYNIVRYVPLWIRDAGNSQEGCWTKERFEELLRKNNNEITHRLLYYHDVEMLVSSFQNRSSSIIKLIDLIYGYLTPSLQYNLPEYDNVIFSSTNKDYELYMNLNNLIITICSCLDILTKIADELEHVHQIKFDLYPKLKSVNTTYGEKVHLNKSLQKTDTIFSPSTPNEIETIIALRNEIIHNGSLDFGYNVYHGAKGKLIEHFIFFPDVNEFGRLTNLKNRKKFYSDFHNTFNLKLPKLILPIIQYLQNTLVLLNKTFYVAPYINEQEYLNYQKEISNWNKI